ncbi:MAG: type IV toxin-antitoxin system AbiEi family antitoxin domain-containing protein [Mycobacteriales bacterium]
MPTPTELRNQLAALASEQAGYFTAAQARELGYDYPQHTFHTNRGNWVRVDRGLYRLPHWPIDQHDDLIRATFLSRGRGVISHESAAVVHRLAEIDPRRTHLTVPSDFQGTHRSLVFHHLSDLKDVDIDDCGGYRVTKPQRTLIDLGRSGTDLDQLGRAIHEALERHLVTLRNLRHQAEVIDAKAALAIERALLEGNPS